VTGFRRVPSLLADASSSSSAAAILLSSSLVHVLIGPIGQYWGMRIVSLLPSATEIVYALGLAEYLVGVTHECDWPPEARRVRVVSHSALPAVAEPAEMDRLVSASIGGGQPIYRLDTDAIRHLRPDLVLSQDLCAVCAVPSGHVNQALDVLGGISETHYRWSAYMV
jgi:hypothetical protein